MLLGTYVYVWKDRHKPLVSNYLSSLILSLSRELRDREADLEMMQHKGFDAMQYQNGLHRTNACIYCIIMLLR